MKTRIGTCMCFTRATFVALATLCLPVPDLAAQQCLSNDPALGLRNCDDWNPGCASANGTWQTDYVSPNEA